MNIIEESEGGDSQVPYAVGTPNATQDVYHHVKAGRERANFFRYFYFNLPKLTKVMLLATVLTIGISAAVVASSAHAPFFYGDVALWIVVFFAAVYVLIGATTRRAIWDFGSFIAVGACVVYIGGILDNAPYVWNGASVGLAATWNLMLFASLVYFVLNWAVNMHILVVWPDSQHFTD